MRHASSSLLRRLAPRNDQELRNRDTRFANYARVGAAVEDPVTANGFITILCGIVVAFYAAKRYDTPETNRLSTTRSLFLLTDAGYIVASLTLFFVLCEIVLRPGVLPFLGLEHAQEVVAKFSAPPGTRGCNFDDIASQHSGHQRLGRMASQALSSLGQHPAGRPEFGGHADAERAPRDRSRSLGSKRLDYQRGRRSERTCRPSQRRLQQRHHAEISRGSSGSTTS